MKYRRLDQVVEKHVAVYWIEGQVSANSQLANSTIERLDFQHEVIDTHDAVTTGANWVFTAPIEGYYRVSVCVPFGVSAAGARQVYIYKNGDLYSRLVEAANAGAANWTCPSGSTVLWLDEGDNLDIRARQDSGGALDVTGDSDRKHNVAIEKI